MGLFTNSIMSECRKLPPGSPNLALGRLTHRTAIQCGQCILAGQEVEARTVSITPIKDRNKRKDPGTVTNTRSALFILGSVMIANLKDTDMGAGFSTWRTSRLCQDTYPFRDPPICLFMLYTSIRPEISRAEVDLASFPCLCCSRSIIEVFHHHYYQGTKS